MTRPAFLSHVSRRLGRKYELVHVESGAVLGSRVEIGGEERPWKRRAWRGGVQGDEPALRVMPTKWTHTCRAPAPVDIIFVDAEGTVVKTVAEVPPWRAVTARGAHAVIEASAGFIEETSTVPGDRLALREAQVPRPLRDVAPARPRFEMVPESVRAAVESSMPDALPEGDDSLDPWNLEGEETAAAAPASSPAVVPVTRTPEPAAVTQAASQQRVDARTPPPAPPPMRLSTTQAPALPTTASPPRTEVKAPPPAPPPMRIAMARPPAPPAPGPAKAPAAAGPAAATTAGRRTPSRPAFAKGVDLDHLIARQTPLAWFEAVAITQELLHVLLASGANQAMSNLEAGDVAITPEGSIELRRDVPRGLPPVPQAARILLTLLAEAQTLPVQLRLLALQEVSPSPSCSSILELSTRLALFERPGRQAAVREVYERYARLPPREAEQRVGVQPPTALTRPALVPWWQSRRVQAVAGAFVLAAVVITGALKLWSSVAPPSSGQADRRGPAAKAVGHAGDSVAAAAAGGARTIAEWIGLAPGDRATAERPAEAPAKAASSDVVLAPRPRPRGGSRAAAPVRVVVPSVVSGGEAAPSSDANVYSGLDPRVVPPSLQRTRLPSAPRLDIPPGEFPEVEVIISEKGEVESVKLITQPTGVLPAMMLSAIKNWRFDPAMKDGQPVRYRMRMLLTNQ